jgi:hypothetical protein
VWCGQEGDVVVGCLRSFGSVTLRRLQAIRQENGMTPRCFALLRMVILLVLLLLAGLLLVRS